MYTVQYMLSHRIYPKLPGKKTGIWNPVLNLFYYWLFITNPSQWKIWCHYITQNYVDPHSATQERWFSNGDDDFRLVFKDTVEFQFVVSLCETCCEAIALLITYTTARLCVSLTKMFQKCLGFIRTYTVQCTLYSTYSYYDEAGG